MGLSETRLICNDEAPTGTILVDGKPMKFWLPQDVSVEELDIEWVPA